MIVLEQHFGFGHGGTTRSCSQLYEILICSPLPRSVTIRAPWAVDRIWPWFLGKETAPPFTCQALISLRSSLSTKMLLSISIFICCIFFPVFWYKICICSICIYILLRWDWKHHPIGPLGDLALPSACCMMVFLRTRANAVFTQQKTTMASKRVLWQWMLMEKWFRRLLWWWVVRWHSIP